MKLIVGLGNPGSKYKNYRHNAGFLVIDELKTRITNNQIPTSKQILISKSKNFMNDSGSFVLSQYTKYNIPYTSLYVIHDDLDIRLGEFKIQFGKGPKGHNGILDIEKKLGTSEFWRVRVGVDNRVQRIGDSVQGERYVLEDFVVDEKVILNKVIKEICRKLETL